VPHLHQKQNSGRSTVHKNNTGLWLFFLQMCICGTAAPQIGRLLPRTRRLLVKTTGFVPLAKTTGLYHLQRPLDLYTHKFPKCC